jgi:hypothetical protein
MGYIPKDAKWYLAEIVQEIKVEGDPRNVVHTNTVLIRADSPEEAYEKSVKLGKEHETSYENPDGKTVTFHFRSLHDLNVIYDELEHGAELTYTEGVGMDEEEIRSLISEKSGLGVFAPISPSKGPDYASGDIIREVYDLFPHLRRTP